MFFDWSPSNELRTSVKDNIPEDHRSHPILRHWVLWVVYYFFFLKKKHATDTQVGLQASHYAISLVSLEFCISLHSVIKLCSYFTFLNLKPANFLFKHYPVSIPFRVHWDLDEKIAWKLNYHTNIILKFLSLPILYFSFFFILRLTLFSLLGWFLELVSLRVVLKTLQKPGMNAFYKIYLQQTIFFYLTRRKLLRKWLGHKYKTT